MTAVCTEHLTKDFFTGFWRSLPKRALDDLSLDVPVGGVFGLLGPNGAGKSTTLKLLVGLLRPTGGRALLLGEPPGALSARRRLGFLPENPTFYDHLSAEELLVYFAGLFGIRGREARRRVADVLDRVGLEKDRRRPVRQYSKGMVQRVGLAQALLNDPELVILDEPMSGLDPLGRRDIRQMIAALGREGRTVVFSSHILSDAEELCERVAILARGRLVASGVVEELASRTDRGWRVVVKGADETTRAAVGRLGVNLQQQGDRLVFEVPSATRPEILVPEVARLGLFLESMTPLRETLEDTFLRALDPAVQATPGREVA
jgi:ABC-2 type transport system ATP-binding protein